MSNADDAKDAIKRGDVNAAMEAASKEAQKREQNEKLSRDRDHGGLDSFKK